jgi:hypothetical protein
LFMVRFGRGGGVFRRGGDVCWVVIRGAFVWFG